MQNSYSWPTMTYVYAMKNILLLHNYERSCAHSKKSVFLSIKITLSLVLRDTSNGIEEQRRSSNSRRSASEGYFHTIRWRSLRRNEKRISKRVLPTCYGRLNFDQFVCNVQLFKIHLVRAFAALNTQSRPGRKWSPVRREIIPKFRLSFRRKKTSRCKIGLSLLPDPVYSCNLWRTRWEKIAWINGNFKDTYRFAYMILGIRFCVSL